MIAGVRQRDTRRDPAEPHECRGLARPTRQQAALCSDATVGEALLRHAEIALGLVAEGVVVFAGADDDARAGRPVARVARLDRDHVRVLRDRALGRDEPRTEQPRLLRPGEGRVHVEGPRLVSERLEHREDERAAGEIVGAPQMQLIPAALECGQVQDRPVADRERLLRADLAVARRAVGRHRIVDVARTLCRMAPRDTVPMDEQLERCAEVVGRDAAAEPREPVRAARLDDLEAGVIGVGDERERAFRRAA